MAEKIARVRAIAPLAPGVVLIDAQAVDPPVVSFRAGQFISLRCGRGDDDVRRSYTIASSPGRADGFELLVKFVEGGAGTEYVRALRPGDELRFTGPMGFFVPDEAHPGDVLFVATGAGVAAAAPMLEEILARSGEAGGVRLLWGVRDGAELFWRDRLDGLAARAPRFAWETVVEPTWDAVHDALVERTLAMAPSPAVAGTTFYLVGNGDLVRRLKKELEARGVDRRRRVHQEVFYPTVEGER